MEMTDELYEKFCAGCPSENICHENCEYCDKVLEILDDDFAGMDQCDRVIKYMTIHGSITAMEALNNLGIMRLASRISDLKRQGYQITRTMVGVKNRYGEKCSVARYTFTNDDRTPHPQTIPGFEWVEETLDEMFSGMMKCIHMDKVSTLNKSE